MDENRSGQADVDVWRRSDDLWHLWWKLRHPVQYVDASSYTRLVTGRRLSWWRRARHSYLFRGHQD